MGTAADLDLAIAVHIANGNSESCDLYRLAPAGRFAQFPCHGDRML
jgi:hypothetical protein